MGKTLILNKKITPQQAALNNAISPKPTMILQKKSPMRLPRIKPAYV